MTLFVTFLRILVIQRKIRASEAQTSSSGGCEIGAESKPRCGRLEREEGRGGHPATARHASLGTAPGDAHRPHTRLRGGPAREALGERPLGWHPATSTSTRFASHSPVPGQTHSDPQASALSPMRPFTPHWVLTVGVAAGRGFRSTRYGFAFLTKHSKFTVCLSLLQTTGVLGEAHPPRTAPARFHTHAVCFCFSLSSPACRHRAAAYLQVPAVRPEGKGQPHT